MENWDDGELEEKQPDGPALLVAMRLSTQIDRRFERNVVSSAIFFKNLSGAQNSDSCLTSKCPDNGKVGSKAHA